MTLQANTRLFNTRADASLMNPFREAANGNFYVFTSRDTSTNVVNESVRTTEYSLFDSMLFGKQVKANDMALMITRYDWVAGTVYAQYDDTDSELFTKNFYCVSPQSGDYHVFKCISNNNGSPSTSQPLFTDILPSDEVYQTADGYQWKYMYSITSAQWTKFTTPTYVPVFANTQVAALAANGSVDNIIMTLGGNNYISYAQGKFTNIAVGGNSVLYSVDTAASNTNFYVGCALYIRNGTGAGQVRQVVYSGSTGTELRVGVDTAFNPQPDLTSEYTLAPSVNIVGDGSNAVGIAAVSNGKITSVNMIAPGRNYSYANVSIVGNTGTVAATGAAARAIIAPRGGHGSNVLAELGANKVGLSVTFANSESGAISTNNAYTRVGVLNNPLFSNVNLTFSSNTGLFIPGETVVQPIGVANAQSLQTALLQNYTYNAGRYKNIVVSGAPVFAVGDKIGQNLPTTTNGTVIGIAGSNVYVKVDYGNFNAIDGVFKIGTPTSNNVVNSVFPGFVDSVFGLDTMANTTFAWSNSNPVEVFVNGEEYTNRGYLPANTTTPSFTVNSTAIQFYNKTIANSDIISVNKYVSTAVVANAQVGAYGTLVAASGGSLKLTNVSGQFVPNTVVYGTQSGATANVASLVGQDGVFRQTTKMLIQYGGGSTSFAYDDQVTQGTAFGYVYDIAVSNATHYALQLYGVKGTFAVGENIVTGNTKIANVASVTAGDLVKYTGNLLYAESVVPISRANNKSETIKLVLKYF